ncbi:hypothetical protein [Zhongshania sp.]|uniref:hypothetical protein n=1 Tax=Zhongshania sp. TaxID=1971902 RepID=UPI001B67C42E|nr:hypothetical protein [Zhongshania sp.]MBQ0794512.1 hypothetical protein [Zhongshania sp.]
MKRHRVFPNISGRLICSLASLFISALSAPAVFAANCTANTPISAHYQISHYEHSAQPETFSHMVLWRRANSVAEQYPERGITELWERNHSNSIKLNRYFDAYQRGIEYSPSEIKVVKTDDDWSMKNQLIADSLLSKMSLSKKSGKACERKEIYTLENDNETITVVWLPAYKIVKSYKRSANGKISHWSLTEMSSDSKIIDAFFIKYLDYQTTDYADIGDSESDPFLRKMINLGFVEHGSSGMYDAQGNDIGGEHHH